MRIWETILVMLVVNIGAIAGAVSTVCENGQSSTFAYAVWSNGTNLLSKSTSLSRTLRLDVQEGKEEKDFPDPSKEKADAMMKKFAGIVTDLNITVLQCSEGIDWLNTRSGEKLHIINAMVPFVGAKAKSCHLDGNGLLVHLHPPTEKTDTCVIYCGETDCPAALTYASSAKDKLKQMCDKIVYLQGGALCFVEHSVPLANRTQCQGIVVPNDPKEFGGLVKELDMKTHDCSQDLAGDKAVKEGFVINMMIPVFGSKAEACNLDGVSVHGAAPTEHHDVCVLYCGESTCPIATKFLKAEKDLLKTNCGEVHFLNGGANCFLKQSLALKDATQCEGIVDPKPHE